MLLKAPLIRGKGWWIANAHTIHATLREMLWKGYSSAEKLTQLWSEKLRLPELRRPPSIFLCQKMPPYRAWWKGLSRKLP